MFPVCRLDIYIYDRVYSLNKSLGPSHASSQGKVGISPSLLACKKTKLQEKRNDHQGSKYYTFPRHFYKNSVQQSINILKGTH